MFFHLIHWVVVRIKLGRKTMHIKLLGGCTLGEISETSKIDFYSLEILSLYGGYWLSLLKANWCSHFTVEFEMVWVSKVLFLNSGMH